MYRQLNGLKLAIRYSGHRRLNWECLTCHQIHRRIQSSFLHTESDTSEFDNIDFERIDSVEYDKVFVYFLKFTSIV